jgi:DNA-binding CsgD family transcriptional regulator
VPPGIPPLVERDAERATLLAALAEPPSVVALEGEPGIGKTSLIQQATVDTALPTRQVLVGHARRSREACPLAPVLEALATAELPAIRRMSPLSGALRAVLPERAESLPPTPPPLADQGLTRHRLLRATVQLLSDLGPLVLVLEDLHWADNDTVELLDILGTRPPPRLSLVISYRTHQVSAGSPLSQVLAGSLRSLVRARIRLAPLSVSGTGALVSQLLGESACPVSPEAVELLHSRSGGNPFVLREDVRLLHKRGLLRLAGGRWRVADPPANSAPLSQKLEATVPDAVSTDILTRVSELTSTGRLMLDAAAVLSDPADPAVLAEVAGLRPDQAVEATAENERVGLLGESAGPRPGPGFRYSLVRHAVYRAMPVARRRRLHTRAAKALAATGDPALADEVARHHRRAGNACSWTRTAEVAADIAVKRGDLVTAYRHLRDLLHDTTSESHRYGRIAAKLGWAALGNTEQSTDCVALLTTALRQPGCSRTQRAEIRLMRALIQLDAMAPHVKSETLAADLRRAIEDLVTRPDLQAIGLATLAHPARLPAFGMRQRVMCLTEGRLALDRTSDPVAHAAMLTSTVSTLLATGIPGCWSALETLPPPGGPVQVDRQIVRGLQSAAESALCLGHHPRAVALVERALEIAEGRLNTYRPTLRAIRARARWLMGDPPAEAQVGQPALEGPAALRLHSGLLTGQVLLSQGRIDSARDILRATAHDACRTGELSIAASAAAELNRSVLSPPERWVAREPTSRVLEYITHAPNWIWAAPLLPFADLDLVREVLADYRAGTAGRDAPLARAALSYVDARLAEADGETARARAGYVSARHRYAALPDPRMAAHAASAEARCLVAEGLPVAPEPLLAAWRTFHDLRASWDADRLKQQIRQAGLPTPHRRGRPGYGSRLSPREHEIADLAATGHTNHDIAVRLYLSERTVKYHLANAMRKLGVTGRRQLSSVLSHRSDGPRLLPEDRRDHTCRCFRCGRGLNLTLTDG